MTTLDKAIHTLGFENPITIAIAVLEEQGKHELAAQLWEEITQGEDLEEDEDYEPDVDETGFDPYEGCYTWDC